MNGPTMPGTYRGRFKRFAKSAAAQSVAVMRELTGDAADAMRAAAPVDTGELRASISVAATENGARIRCSSPHAAFVEFGTQHQKPQPFFRNAVRRQRQALKTKLAKAVEGSR